MVVPRPDKATARLLFRALLRQKRTLPGEIVWTHILTTGRARVILDELEIQPRLSLVSSGDQAAIEPIRECLKRALGPHPNLSAIRAYRLSEADGVVIRDSSEQGGRREQPMPLSEDRIQMSSGWMHGQILYQLVRAFQPSLCLELGTAYGVSGLYLLTGSDNTRLVTIEADPARRAEAVTAFRQFGVEDRVTSLLGTFADELPRVLSEIKEPLQFVFDDAPDTFAVFESVMARMAPRGVYVIDNIYATPGYEAAWRERANHKKVLASAEVSGRLGICVSRG